MIAPRLRSANVALALAKRMSNKLHGDAAIGDVSVVIAASIGVAWTSTTTARELLARADAAMYNAKQAHTSEPVLAPA